MSMYIAESINNTTTDCRMICLNTVDEGLQYVAEMSCNQLLLIDSATYAYGHQDLFASEPAVKWTD